MEYIDVRGSWPIYVNGHRTVTLEGVYNQSITVEDARAIVAERDRVDADREARRPPTEHRKDVF